MKWINAGKGGTIFINCMRPAGKLLHKAMRTNIPPHAKVAIGATAAALAVAGLGYFVWMKSTPERS